MRVASSAFRCCSANGGTSHAARSLSVVAGSTSHSSGVRRPSRSSFHTSAACLGTSASDHRPLLIRRVLLRITEKFVGGSVSGLFTLHIDQYRCDTDSLII